MKLIVFDTEATGVEQAQICQLSALTIEDGRMTGENRYFTVDEMGEVAQQMHGLSMEMLETLSGGRRFSDCADELFREFSEADLLVGHNVSADVRYLKQEFTRLGMAFAPKKTFCTMNAFTRITGLRRRYGGSPKPPKLEELAAHYDLSPDVIARQATEWFGGGVTAHDARYDAAATCLCLFAAAQSGDLAADVKKFLPDV